MSVAYLFPGQGAQHIGMGVGLAEVSPAAAEVFAEASDALGTDVLEQCRTGPAELLADTEVAQPALLTVGVAALTAARAWLPAPTWMAGLSLGEYTALVAAGALDLADAVRLVRARGRLMAMATRDRDVSMAAVVGLEREAVWTLCAAVAPAGHCQPALYNAERQIVVSGDRAAVDLLVEQAEQGSARATRIAVSSAFHTELMSPASAELAELLAAVEWHTPRVPVVSNVLATPVTDPDRIRAGLLEQLDRPVRWAESMRFLVDAGVDTVVELGPGRVLTGLARSASRRLTTVIVDDAESLAAVRLGAVAADAPTTDETGTSHLVPIPREPEDGMAPVPRERARAYFDAGWWTDSSLLERIIATAARRPAHQPALVSPGVSVTYGELAGAVERTAAALATAGIGRRDRVVVQLGNVAAFPVLVLALWRVEAVAVMALPGYREFELRHVLDTSGAVALALPRRLHRADHLAVARRLMVDRPQLQTLIAVDSTGAAAPGDDGADVIDLDRLVAPEPGDPAPPIIPGAGPHPADLALLLLSGGTTGPPKLIGRTQRDYLYNVVCASTMARLDEATIYLAALPVAHNFALGCPGALGALLNGGTVVFPRSPLPNDVLDALLGSNATITAAVPTLAAQVAEAATERAARPDSLAVLQVGGARLVPEAARLLRAQLGCTIQQVYGMAEGLLNFTRLDDPDDVVDDTQGRPMSPGDEIRIVTSDGSPAAGDEVGELLTRGPYTIAGYYHGHRDDDAFDDDGWFRTGDLVRRHPSGNLVVEGRIKDVINRAGEKVSAPELENTLLRHPAIRRVAVVAAPDSALGECVCAVVTTWPEHSIDLAELRGFLLDDGFARYKLPERLMLLDGLPLTAVGKVDRAQLRRMAAGEP